MKKKLGLLISFAIVAACQIWVTVVEIRVFTSTIVTIRGVGLVATIVAAYLSFKVALEKESRDERIDRVDLKNDQKYREQTSGRPDNTVL